MKYSMSSFLTQGTLQKLLLLSSEMKIALRRPLHVGVFGLVGKHIKKAEERENHMNLHFREMLIMAFWIGAG